MAYSFQTFNAGQVLTAAQMNQTEVNIRDHVHGVAGVSGGNNVIALQTNLVSVGNTTTAAIISSFGIPADALGSNSAIRFYLAGVDAQAANGDITYFNLSLGGTGVHSIQLSGRPFVASLMAITLEYIIAGAGSTSLQIISGGLLQHLVNVSSYSGTNPGLLLYDVTTHNADATTALNFAIRVDFDSAAAGLNFKKLYAMAERIYL